MKTDKLIKIYSGTELSILSLKDRLEKSGIIATIRNDSNDSFLGCFPVVIDLYIQNSDLKKAKAIINKFIKN